MSYLLNSDQVLSCLSKLAVRLVPLLTVRRATRWSVTATGKHLRDRPLNLLPGRDVYGRRLPQALRIEANFMVTFFFSWFIVPCIWCSTGSWRSSSWRKRRKLWLLHIDGYLSPSRTVGKLTNHMNYQKRFQRNAWMSSSQPTTASYNTFRLVLSLLLGYL